MKVTRKLTYLILFVLLVSLCAMALVSCNKVEPEEPHMPNTVAGYGFALYDSGIGISVYII